MEQQESTSRAASPDAAVENVDSSSEDGDSYHASATTITDTDTDTPIVEGIMRHEMQARAHAAQTQAASYTSGPSTGNQLY